MEYYRDVLLAVKNTEGHLLRIMNYTNINHKQLHGLLAGMCARKLLMRFDELSDERRDGRSEYHFELTKKGGDVCALLVELMDYIEDGAEPDPKSQPPVFLLRQMMLMRGLTLDKPKEVAALPSQEGKATTPEVLYHRGWYPCPRCGTEVPTYRGLKAHITKKHHEEREELLEQIKIQYEGRAMAL